MRLLRCALALGCLAHSVVNGESRGLVSGGGLLEPTDYTDEAFASYPLLDESISSAATGTHGFNPATGASGVVDVLPTTIDDADEGSAQASGVLEAVRSLEGQLATQQRSLDEIFSASQTRCKDDAVALAQQVALLQGAIAQKEQHKKRSHELVRQPDQFIALNKEVLRNLESEYKDAKKAFEHQRKLVTEQSLTINTALSTAAHALNVLKEAYSRRSDLRVNEKAEATAALLEVASLTDLDRVGLTSQRMALKAALKAAGVETPLEAEVKAEEEAKVLTHQSDEQREALASAQADLEQATKAEEKAKAHAAEIAKRAEAIRAEVEEETTSLGALSSLVGGDADTGKSASEIAAELIKKESAKAEAQVKKAHQFVQEEAAHTKEVRAAVNAVEDKLADATKKRAAMINTSDRLVKDLRAALETVVDRLRTQHSMTTAQLHAAKARFDTIAARIEEEAPVLRESIRKLEDRSGEEEETLHALDVRRAQLEKQLVHVREQFVTLASRCEHEATDYARRTDARTAQRRQLRILAQHLEVQLTAVQRSLAAAHAAATVHKMHDAMKAKVLFESLKNDAEMDAAAFRGASDIVTEGEGETPFATGGFGMGGLGGPTGLYGRAIHEVETGHAPTEKVLHERVRLARDEDQSVQDAAEGAVRAARDMRVLLARDLKLKQQFAREEALEVVRLRKVKAETKEREAAAQTMYDGAREFVAKFKAEVEPMFVKIRALVEVQTGDVTEPAFDRVQGIVTLPEGAPESIKNSTISDLINAALDMPEYPESEVQEAEEESEAAPAAALVEVKASLRAGRRRATARANSPFEDAIAELRPEWVKYQTAKKRLAALKEAAEKAAYEARMAEVQYASAMRAARNAAAVAQQAAMRLDANKAMWKSLEEYATDVLGMPMPVELKTDPCGNDTASCTPRHENGEAARIMVEELRKKHALLLRREKVLREIEHKVAEARAHRVTRTADEEEAGKLQPAADRAVEDAHKELDQINEEVGKVSSYIADADAEALMKSLTQTTDAGADAVEGAGNAVALVSGDEADTAEKVMNEMSETVPPRSDAANQQELSALRAAVVAKKEELAQAREDLEQQRTSLEAAKNAVEEASASGYKAAMRDAEKLRQMAEKSTQEAEARVSRLEEVLHKMQGEEEVLAEEYKEAPEVVEEEQVVEPEPEEDAPTPVLPAVDTMSKVDAQEKEAERVTRAADLEAKAWRAGQPVVPKEEEGKEPDNAEAIAQLA